jgi:hypothetical protein
MTKNSQKRDRAERQFLATQARRVGPRLARIEYEEAARAVDEKTARLKSLRLAKEEAETTTEAKKEPSRYSGSEPGVRLRKAK